MKIDRIQVTFEPWEGNDGYTRLAIRVDTSNRTFQDVQMIPEDQFDSLFDRLISRAARLIKVEVKKDRTP